MSRVVSLFFGAVALLVVGCEIRPDGPLTCTDAITCDGKTQYCSITTYAQPIDDAGTTQTAECVDFPSTCSSQSCTCFGGASTGACGCAENKSGVTVTTCTP
jgi:hypothetical protein